MATTTNYGWSTPDDTAFVSQGAAAIRTLGSSVDTTTKNLNPSTTLGDVEYRSSTANTNTRLGIGTTGQVLTVAGGVPSWAALPIGGGMTLISTTPLGTGASIVLSSIPQTFNDLVIVIRNWKAGTGGQDLHARINGDSGANRYINQPYGATAGTFNDTRFNIAQTSNPSTVQGFARSFFPDYTNTTTWKTTSSLAFNNDNVTATSWRQQATTGCYNQVAAITSITLFPNSGNFASGDCLLYGVK